MLGSGVCRKVIPSVKLPSSLKSFLYINEINTELFHFLATCLTDTNSSDKVIIDTFNKNILMTPNSVESIDDLQPCNHEEADSKIFLHLKEWG